MRRTALLLALGCGWLALPCAWAQDNSSGGGNSASSLPRSSALPWLKLDELTATRERPLFAPDRRPQPPAKPPPTIVTPQPPSSLRPEFVLKGIISEGSETFVLLEDMSMSESVLVRAGGTIGAWQIVIESDHSVILAGQGERIKLQMFEEDGSK